MADSADKDDVRNLAKTIGKVVATRRRTLKLSQEQFAEKVGCHRTYVGFIERGEKNITIFTLKSFAEALGCSPSQLLSEAGM